MTVSAPDLDVGAWAWVQTRVNRPALSRPSGGRASRQEQKRSAAVVDPVCIFSSCGVTRRVRMSGPFLLEQKYISR